MSEWKTCRLGDVADLCLGKMLDAKKNRGSPKPYLNNVAVRWGMFDLDDLPEMRFEDDEFDRYTVRRNDIVACEGGEPGRCAIWNSDSPMYIQKALHRIRVDGSVNCPQFVYYQFTYLVKSGQTRGLETGSTIRHLPGQALAQVELSLPDLPTQRRIAAVLGALDDKIELNRKMNATLEAMAQALFKSWFVDFEPFGGQMPEGWRRGTLGEIAEIVGGGTPSKAHNEFYANQGIAWLTPRDLSITHAKFTSHGSIDISQTGYDNSSARLMPKGSVLFSSRAPIGYLTIAENEICTNQGFKSLVPIAHVGTAFLYYYMLFNTDRIQRMASGSTFKEASGSLIKGLELNLPDDEICDNFEEMMRPIFGKQRILEHQSRTLAQLRDTLLPKLMRGELNVEGVKIEDAAHSAAGGGVSRGDAEARREEV